MAYSKSIRRTPTATHSHKKEVYGLVLFAIASFVSMALLSYNPTDPGFHTASNLPEVRNLGGVIGAYLADFLFTTFGLTAYLAGGLLFFISFLKFRGLEIGLRFRSLLLYVGLLVSVSTLLHLHLPEVHIATHPFAGGGIIGSLFGVFLVRYLNRTGTQVFALTSFLVSLVLLTEIKLSSLVINTGNLCRYFGQQLLQWLRVTQTRLAKWSHQFWGWFGTQLQSLFAKKTREDAEDEEDIEEEDLEEDSDEEEESEDAGEEEEENAEKENLAAKPEAKRTKITKQPALVPVETPTLSGRAAARSLEGANGVEPKIYERADTGKKAPTEEQLRFLKISASGFTPPPLSLLDSANQTTATVDEESLKKNAQLLEKKLLDFDVQGRVTEIHPGPVITMYEYEPSPGVKVSKIVNLESDLALAMGGKSIRIVPHLPGKAALGIEIPNHERETVWLKDIIGSQAFQKSKSKLTIALGKDTEGRPLVHDLTKMPHLLIAGATGAGKSVGINSMIISMLYKATPEEVRFIMVDPKRLELSVYEGIPHLLLPVVTQPKQAVAALKWALREMERRYRLLADAGTRNIVNYNEKIEQGTLNLVSEEEAKDRYAVNKEAICHTGKLSYLVILIDELADMMMIASQEFEETITRLAQMARAAGIHLILATQRPSVDVITGLIKANFPARISFKVSSKHDSRTILDQIGSETLLGNGDMLFMPPSAASLARIHGAYITEGEIARVVSHIKEQGAPVYDTSVLATETEPQGDGIEIDEEDGQIYDQAVKLVSETRQASISMIQRRLRIGYNRAARMIEKMESQGIVGPQDGAKPRQVFVNNIGGTPG